MPTHLDPVLCNREPTTKRSPCTATREEPPLAATTESPRAAAKTQHGQKEKKDINFFKKSTQICVWCPSPAPTCGFLWCSAGLANAPADIAVCSPGHPTHSHFRPSPLLVHPNTNPRATGRRSLPKPAIPTGLHLHRGDLSSQRRPLTMK